MKKSEGIVIVFAALAIFVLIAFAALALDVGHIFVVNNELRNAADAGALAGAANLYNATGTAVNSGANLVAYNAATANRSEQVLVDVHWSGGNTGDVERGHWSFATRHFTPNPTLVAHDLWGIPTADLDDEVKHPDFINAVRVTTRREDTPAASFFARIFGPGFSSFVRTATSVAYIGFAGRLEPHDVDQPIAICKQSILDPTTGEYNCSRGRMINSGSGAGHQTGGWTNFSQPCSTASNSSVNPLVCSSGNPGPISLGAGMGTTGGMLEASFDDLIGCWQTQAGLPRKINSNNPADYPTTPWKMTLAVIDCTGNNVGPCSTVLGAVELNVIWITRTGFKNYVESGSGNAALPVNMGGIPGVVGSWTSPGGIPANIWTSFVSHYNLRDVDGTPATPEDKTIYFLPDCTPHVPAGHTGGENFGIRAKYPVIVQ